MLSIDTPILKIAKKTQKGREQQKPNVFDALFCCVKLPPINEALYNMNNKKPYVYIVTHLTFPTTNVL